MALHIAIHISFGILRNQIQGSLLKFSGSRPQFGNFCVERGLEALQEV
jgi:hypothetical protein